MQLNKFLAIFLVFFITNIFSADSNLQDQLKEALMGWETDKIEQLLTEGADLNGEWSDGQSIFNKYIFNISSENTLLENLSFLLKHGANLHVRDSKFGFNPLMTALVRGHYKLAQKLLEISDDSRSDVNNIDKNGETLLMKVPSTKFDLLFQYGAADTINHQNNEGRTALMHVAGKCNLPAVQLLINNGSNFKLRDNKGKTVLNYAEERSYWNQRTTRLDNSSCVNLIDYLLMVFGDLNTIFYKILNEAEITQEKRVDLLKRAIHRIAADLVLGKLKHIEALPEEIIDEIIAQYVISNFPDYANQEFYIPERGNKTLIEHIKDRVNFLEARHQKIKSEDDSEQHRKRHRVQEEAGPA